jgi:hypothetical protein
LQIGKDYDKKEKEYHKYNYYASKGYQYDESGQEMLFSSMIIPTEVNSHSTFSSFS